MHWLDNRYRTPLPIDEKLGDILQLIKTHQVVICCAETGSGKTTRVAQAAILENSNLAVTMTQPRRNACRWNAERIASELGCRPGQLVGWKLSREPVKISNETRLVLTVDMTLLNRISKMRKLPPGLMIIDEVHERSQALDLLLSLVRLYLPDSPHTRILLMSATLDAKRLSDFYSGAPCINIKGRCYPVEECFFPLLKGEHHFLGAMRAAMLIAGQFFSGSLSVPGEGSHRISIHKGAVIILLPGKKDVEQAVKILSKIKSNRKKIEVLACHSLIPSQEQKLIQTVVPPKTLRFICGTDSLRSCVTVPETVGVIDSLQVKREYADCHGTGRLHKISVSKAEAEQAKGRAGRTQPGFYLPVSYNDEYYHLKDWPTPAILREPLDNLLMNLSFIGMPLRTFPFLERIPQKNLNETIHRLQQFDLLDEKENLTETGKSLSINYWGVYEEKTLIFAQILGVLSETIILLGILGDAHFFLPDQAGEVSRRKWGESDFVALINAYRAYKAQENILGDRNDLRKWCLENQLHYETLAASDYRIKNFFLNWSMEKPCDFFHERPFDEGSLMKAFIAGNIHSYGVKEGRLYRDHEDVFTISSSSLCPQDAFLIMYSFLKTTTGYAGNNCVLKADIAAPIKYEWLAEIHPKLCYTKEFGEYQYDASVDQILRKEGQFFRKLKITEKLIAVTDDVARQELSALLAINTIRLNSLLNQPAVDEIIRENKKIQNEADALNLKAGKILHKVYKSVELQQYYLHKLNGARNLKQVPDLNVLALPPLNKPKKIEAALAPIKATLAVPAPKIVHTQKTVMATTHLVASLILFISFSSIYYLYDQSMQKHKS